MVFYIDIMCTLQVVVVNGSTAPVYTPAKHYTISSSGEVVMVEEPEVNHVDHLGPQL